MTLVNYGLQTYTFQKPYIHWTLITCSCIVFGAENIDPFFVLLSSRPNMQEVANAAGRPITNDQSVKELCRRLLACACVHVYIVRFFPVRHEGKVHLARLRLISSSVLLSYNYNLKFILEVGL